MGAILRSAAATVLTAVTILFVGSGANSAFASGAVHADSDEHGVIFCPDSMVWDGIRCVEL
jgi:hypothetical protein